MRPLAVLSLMLALVLVAVGAVLLLRSEPTAVQAEDDALAADAVRSRLAAIEPRLARLEAARAVHAERQPLPGSSAAEPRPPPDFLEDLERRLSALEQSSPVPPGGWPVQEGSDESTQETGLAEAFRRLSSGNPPPFTIGAEGNRFRIRLAEQLLEDRPWDPDAEEWLRNLVASLQLNGDRQGALRAMERFAGEVTFSSEYIRPDLWRSVHGALGNFEGERRALRELVEVVTSESQRASLLYRVGLTYMKEGRYERAREHLAQLLEERSDSLWSGAREDCEKQLRWIDDYFNRDQD